MGDSINEEIIENEESQDQVPNQNKENHEQESQSKENPEQESQENQEQETGEQVQEQIDEEAISYDEDGNLIVKKRRKKKKKKNDDVKPEDINIVRELLSLIVYIGCVILGCYLILTYVGCRSRVDGSSMNPTFENNDNLWVDKLSYTFGDPKRFDVIIFNYDDKTTYIKRIIGLPGETVRIDQNGCIFINEQLLNENYGMEKISPRNLGRANQPVLLGENEYFVLGDNRNNSSDSRWADVGNVNREDIVGKAVFRFYPFSSIGFVD